MIESDEQRGLRDSVRRLLAKRSDSAAVRRAVQTPAGYDEALWQTLCEQIGVAALAIPEEFGGVGAGVVETHIVMDECGRGLTPSPMLGSAVLAARLLVELGDDVASRRLLPRIAEGEVAAVAWVGEEGRWWPDVGAVHAQDGRLRGTAHYVLGGERATIMFVVADGAVYEVDPTATQRRLAVSMDPTRRLATVSLDGVPGARIGPADAGPALAAARDAAAIALSAEQVGAAERILELTIEYTKVRQQFGRAIGSFQALKHRMADLHVLAEAARSASYAAASGHLSASVAKVYCSEAFTTISAEAIQLHGGIAITWEHDAHLYFKRAHGSAQLFGQPHEHVARLAAAGDAG